MKIELRGKDDLLRILDKATANETLRPGMARAVKFVKGTMKEYPPPVPGSTYRRGQGKSERLGQSWTDSVSTGASGVVGKVGNNVSYGPFVQSRRFQARVHKGRWTTAEDLLESEFARRNITEFLQDEIDKALGGK